MRTTEAKHRSVALFVASLISFANASPLFSRAKKSSVVHKKTHVVSKKNQKKTPQKEQTARTPAVIEVRVNKDVITNIDIQERLNLLAFLLNQNVEQLQHLRGQVIQRLIDETLYEQLGERFKFNIQEDAGNHFVEESAANHGLTKVQFIQHLKERGAYNSFMKMIRKHLIHSYIVMGGAQKELTRVSETELEDAIKKLKANKTEVQYFLSEIVFCQEGVAVETDKQPKSGQKRSATQQNKSAKTSPGKSAPSPTPSTSALAAANRVYNELMEMTKKMPSFAAFRIMAQQFSQGASADEGGKVGWSTEGQMDQPTREAVKRLKIGEISKPLLMPDGSYKILMLNNKKSPGMAPDSEKKLKIVAVSIPFNPSMSRGEVEVVQRRLATLGDCVSEEEFRGIASDFGYKVVTVLREEIALPDIIRDAKINTCTPPLFTGESLDICMVLGKEHPKSEENIDRAEVEEALQQRKRMVQGEKIFKAFQGRSLIEFKNPLT
ncbi:MAG: peptidylprolyl isomerase [Holosporales bacterium]|nr:peptidylprolyl isomerase [Holosporales bacterium]